MKKIAILSIIFTILLIVSSYYLIKALLLYVINYVEKEVNNRNIVVFDVLMEYLDRNPIQKKGKHPINVTMKTDKFWSILI